MGRPPLGGGPVFRFTPSEVRHSGRGRWKLNETARVSFFSSTVWNSHSESVCCLFNRLDGFLNICEDPAGVSVFRRRRRILVQCVRWFSARRWLGRGGGGYRLGHGTIISYQRNLDSSSSFVIREP